MRWFLSQFFLASLMFPGGSIAMAQTSAPAAAPAPAQAPKAAFDGKVAQEAVTELAKALEDNFVSPEAGTRYAAMLRANLAKGAYASFPTAKAFADQVTADLQAVHKDGHLRVHVVPPEGRGGPREERQRPTLPADSSVTRAGWLAPGVAYIDFAMFPGNEATLADVRSFLERSAGAEVLIIDARKHRGGGLAEMNLLFPALYSSPTTLVQMDTRKAVADRQGTPLGEIEFVRTVAGPDTVLRQEHHVVPAAGGALKGSKVFLLTSNRTASAAEHLALSLKRTGRATLVGETTRGAGNFGAMVPLDKGFRYSAFIPVGRTFDPVTNEGWEGKGISPDIAVSADQALAKALELAGAKVDAATALAQLGPVRTSAR